MKEIIIAPKSSSEEISYKLNAREFRCKCSYKDCNYTLISYNLKKSWELTRRAFGRPLKINSGFRCQKHNSAIGGVSGSRHLLGEAIDISHSGFNKQYRQFLLELVKENFDVVLIYDTFYHCHNFQ